MLTYLAVPMVGNAMLTVVTPVITSIYVGRLNSATLMGASTLGNMMCNITGYSVAFGMCAALDTLIAQAYGAQRFDLVGIHTQRAIVILTLFSFPVAIIWSITDKILYYALDIDKETSDLSGVWARHIVYGLWPTLMFQILRKYLQGISIIHIDINQHLYLIYLKVVISYGLLYWLMLREPLRMLVLPTI